MAKKREETREEARRKTLAAVAKEVDGEKQAEVITPERIALAYRRVFDGPDGEIVLADLKAKFNGTTIRIRPTGIDPYEVVHREGQRSLYLYLVEYKSPPPAPTTTESDA